MNQSQPLTILFADISGSTKLFELRGDVYARQLIGAILGALGDECLRHGGQIIKTIGDEIMCIFPTPLQGVLSAVDMQKRVTYDPFFARENIAIRIGLHHGEALLEQNLEQSDVYGDAVNTAARMTSLAKREQIVATASTIQILNNVTLLHTRSLGSTHVAGKLLPIEIVDIMWREDTTNVTRVQHAVRVDTNHSAGQTKLSLNYRAQIIEIEELSPVFTLGRDIHSSLVIEAEWVSRNHAIIEYKRGHFILADRSTNGTYVKLDDDEELRLHRDEFHLRRTGTISLGLPIGHNLEHVMYFQCLDNVADG